MLAILISKSINNDRSRARFLPPSDRRVAGHWMQQPQIVYLDYKMADNVKVAVRVRPFNSREKTRNSTIIIEMKGQSTEILDPENPKNEPRIFSFDYSYWSHDEFKERSDGYLEPNTPKYADQQIVFNDLGLGVLDNAWKGYNTSLFAYGQTGSGKSYSMVGYGANKGIVPLACEELFSAIEKKRSDAKEGEEYQVTFSMLEIYNEQVRDLLNPKSLKVKGGLKVRQHSNKGFYVEQLMTVPVNSYTEIDSKINEGTKNRTVASTNMNATSSRAHTIVAINFTQKSPNAAGQSMTKTSVINLVDLAGSERADATGATGDRLKEGAGINQSLSTLGNCIKALADMSNGKKSIIVPFRDSVLTKLLKNALGGNSKTIMIAALSPADINYDETLSTLRFADRAKAIKTQAVVNESPTEKLIRELREENARLMEQLKSGGVMPSAPSSGGGDGGAAVEEMRTQMEEELRRNQEEMAAMQETWQQKMAEREKEFQVEIEATKQKKEQQKTIPHFWNLNEDPSLTAMIVHFTPKGKTRLGSSKANPPPDITLAGLSIQPEHALVENDGKKKVTLLPLPGAKVVLNGNEIKDKKELHHNDRYND
ncbi:Kinesin-related protein 1 [Lamellibrachia satsuma]|nr:Kinesin-related protein 1 [Lamellibrachia satsuma]